MSWLINVNTARVLEKTETLGHNEKPQIHRPLKNSNNTLHIVQHLQTIITRNKISIKKLKVEDSKIRTRKKKQ